MIIVFRAHVKKLKTCFHPSSRYGDTPFISSPPPPPPDSLSSTPTQIGDNSRNLDETQVAQRSRWQAVLLEAGALSAALSDESMQRLKYCLHWLLS